MIIKSERNPNDFVDRGTWHNGKTTWEFWRSEVEPDPTLCSAIGLVAIIDLSTNSVVLTQNERGWEMIAGTIKRHRNESPTGATKREALEEGGFVVARQKIFGYREIVNDVTAEETKRKNYPSIAYMPYYYGFTDEPLQPPSGREIIGCGVYSLGNEETKAMLKPGELLLMQIGLQAAREAYGT